MRPLLRPLLLAFVLVALDALATLALPVLIRTGVDSGVSEAGAARDLGRVR